MKLATSALFALVVIVAVTAGLALAPRGRDAGRMPLAIVADRDTYVPLMSSTVGIGLTPAYPASIDNTTVIFRWQADYGHFVCWQAPDFKVDRRGQELTTGDGEVFWSYSPDEMGKEKPLVHVTLTMVDKASGRAMNTSGLTIGWQGCDTAVVKT